MSERSKLELEAPSRTRFADFHARRTSARAVVRACFGGAALALSLTTACGSDGGGEGSSGGAGGLGAQGSSGAAGDGANAAFSCTASGERFATSVTQFEFGSGQSFGQDAFPDAVLGPPSGGGCCAGSLEVTSLGDAGYVVLEFRNNVIVDGPGADFIVFENAFQPQGAAPETVFAELGVVSVSQDGETWSTYECSATSYPYRDCAGWRPVLANAESNPFDPTTPELAGGDAFDLGALGLDFARYVKIQDVPESEGGAGTFDLDAVAIVHAGCP